MAKVWNMDKTVKYEPATVDRWRIREPGRIDFLDKERKPLTQWQVEAVFCRKAAVDGIDDESGEKIVEIVYVGYYDSQQEAVEAVDELDALGMEKMVDSVGKLRWPSINGAILPVEKEPENDPDKCD